MMKVYILDIDVYMCVCVCVCMHAIPLTCDGQYQALSQSSTRALNDGLIGYTDTSTLNGQYGCESRGGDLCQIGNDPRKLRGKLNLPLSFID